MAHGDPESVGPTGLGTYRATVDRSGLENGIYTGTIVFASDRNDVEVRRDHAGGRRATAQADAGHHYILLVNPDTLKTARTLEASATNGAYPFDFAGVQPGDYLLVAGTDSDDDG